MTESMPTPDADDALAAEYVLGVLDDTERQAAAQRARADAAFAARISVWETHLENLNNDYGTQAPPKHVKVQIDRRLFGAPPRRGLNWIVTGLATAVVLLGLFLFQTGQSTQPDLRAQLQSDGSAYAFSVAVDLDDRLLEMALLAGARPTDGTFELWLIPEDGAPQSLGIFASGDALTLAPHIRLSASSTLAVSLEPSGGSPTGAPTGPVLAVGVLADV